MARGRNTGRTTSFRAIQSAADFDIPPAVAKAAMETKSRASLSPIWKPIGSNCVPGSNRSPAC